MQRVCSPLGKSENRENIIFHLNGQLFVNIEHISVFISAHANNFPILSQYISTFCVDDLLWLQWQVPKITTFFTTSLPIPYILKEHKLFDDFIRYDACTSQ